MFQLYDIYIIQAGLYRPNPAENYYAVLPKIAQYNAILHYLWQFLLFFGIFAFSFAFLPFLWQFCISIKRIRFSVFAKPHFDLPFCISYDFLHIEMRTFLK